MLFLIKNRVLTRDRDKTYLTKSSASSSTANQVLTVQGVDSNAFADNDYVIVGEIGTNTAEIMRISASVSDGTSLTVSRSTTSGADTNGLRYDHAIGEPVSRIAFNQIEISHNTTDTTTGATVLTTTELKPNEEFTGYEDTTYTTGYGFVRYKNEETGTFSSYSDGIPYVNQSSKSLYMLMLKVRALIGEQTDEFIKDDEIRDSLNDKQRDIAQLRLWSFYEKERSFSSVANQFAYTIPSGIKDGTVHTVTFDTQPLASINRDRWNMLHFDTDQSTTDPYLVSVWNDEIKIYPRPSDSAATTTLDGGITASDTTITVVATSSFQRGDYFRFIIDSEVIYATGSSSTTFTGCRRGMESTTAATHLTAATVTERDIVFTGQEEPTDLVDLNDETDIPDPLVLALGSAADISIGKLKDQSKYDRLSERYATGVKSLEAKYMVKITGQFKPVKDSRMVTRDGGSLKNPNSYPRDIPAP